MLLLRKIFILIICSVIVAACGFQPLYQQSGNNNSPVAQELTAVKIERIGENKTLIDHLLKVNLTEELNPLSKNTPKRYALNIELKQSNKALAVKKDKEITRYNLVFTAKFKLSDIATGEILDQDDSRIVGGYDAVTSDFATYSAERDTERLVVKELARDIKLKLISYFLSDKEQSI